MESGSLPADAETENLYQQVLAEHERMKHVLLKELLRNGQAAPDEGAYLDQAYNDEPGMRDLADLNLKQEIKSALAQSQWDPYNADPSESVFNEDQFRPSSKSIDRLMNSSSQLDRTLRFQRKMPSYKVLERLQGDDMKRAINVVKGQELSGFFENDKYFLQIGFSKGGIEGSKSGLQQREESLLGLTNVRKLHGKVKTQLSSQRSQLILKDVKPCKVDQVIQNKMRWASLAREQSLLSIRGPKEVPRNDSLAAAGSAPFLQNMELQMKRSSTQSKTDRPYSQTSRTHSTEQNITRERMNLG